MSALLLLLAALQDPADLIEGLRSNSPEARDVAERRLRDLGEPARTALEAARSDANPEVAARAKRLVATLDADAGTAALKAIEAGLAGAARTRIDIQGEGSASLGSPDDLVYWSRGSLVLGTEGRLRFTVERLASMDKVDHVMASKPGLLWGQSTLQVNNRYHDPIAVSARLSLGSPEGFRAGFVPHFVRLGTLALGDYGRTMVFSGTLSWPKEPPDIGDLRRGDLDGAARTLSFRLWPKHARAVGVKLWYDPDRYRVLKRSVTLPDGASFLETYAVAENIDVPDAAFEGPGQGPFFVRPGESLPEFKGLPLKSVSGVRISDGLIQSGVWLSQGDAHIQDDASTLLNGYTRALKGQGWAAKLGEELTARRGLATFTRDGRSGRLLIEAVEKGYRAELRIETKRP